MHMALGLHEHMRSSAIEKERRTIIEQCKANFDVLLFQRLLWIGPKRLDRVVLFLHG
jgi:hypothetical protein